MPDILRATSRLETQTGPGLAASRFVPSARGALGGVATVATIAAGLYALNSYLTSEPDMPVGQYEHRVTHDGFPAYTPAYSTGHTPAQTPKSPDPPGELKRQMSDGISWFKDLFGFVDHDSETLESRQKKFEYDKITGTLALASSPGKMWKAGHFTTPSLKELREKSRQMRRELEAHAENGTTVTFASSDVAILHGKPEYAGAVFQADSKFNCLQPSASDRWPEQGVAIYAEDKKQGPACAISCAPGTIVRSYFALAGNKGTGSKGKPSNKKKEAEKLFPQSKETQVENLGDLITGLTEQADGKFPIVSVSNGYARSNGKKLQKVNERIGKRGPRVPGVGQSSAGREGLLGLMRVGVQQDTQVTCTKMAQGENEPWYEVKSGADPLLVTQVDASALSMSDAVDSDTTREQWEPLARLILDAAYEATLHAAVIHAKQKRERKRVVLTALGSESGNDMKWISDAIVRALKLFKNAGLDVVINVYRDQDLAEIKSAIVADAETSSLLLTAPHGFGRGVLTRRVARPLLLYTE